MKSILYVGATLMIGASIYGFVDYKKTSHKKEFIRMYEDQPPIVGTEEKEATTLQAATVEEVKAAPVKKEKTIAKTKIEITAATKLEKEAAIASIPSIKEIKKVAQNKKAKRKKLDYTLFSRSRPPREIVELDVVPEKQ